MKIRCMNCMKEYEDEYEICPNCGYIRGTKPKESYHLRPETILHDKYEIGTVIGFGGFGVIYKAWDSIWKVHAAGCFGLLSSAICPLCDFDLRYAVFSGGAFGSSARHSFRA